MEQYPFAGELHAQLQQMKDAFAAFASDFEAERQKNKEEIARCVLFIFTFQFMSYTDIYILLQRL